MQTWAGTLAAVFLYPSGSWLTFNRQLPATGPCHCQQKSSIQTWCQTTAASGNQQSVTMQNLSYHLAALKPQTFSCNVDFLQRWRGRNVRSCSCAGVQVLGTYSDLRLHRTSPLESPRWSGQSAETADGEVEGRKRAQSRIWGRGGGTEKEKKKTVEISWNHRREKRKQTHTFFHNWLTK